MNNRQAGRRGRGRNNNNRGSNNRGGGGIDRDNRIDNRARGNAAQMLDKYKKMAQDAQVNGDRVNAEYYHQFADHYFRVNADAQARRDEQRQAREDARDDQNNNGQNSNSQNSNGADRGADRGSDEGRQPRQPARQSSGRSQKDVQQRDNRGSDSPNNGPDKTDDGDKAQDGVVVEKKPVRARRPRNTEPRKTDNGAGNGMAASDGPESNGLDASALPPAISVSSDDAPAETKAEKKPARKPRKLKAKAAEEGGAA